VECYFSPWSDLASGDAEVEGAGVALAELLDELQVEKKEIVAVPDSFRVPASQIAAVECEQMIARQDSIAFMAIPKHSSVYVQTAEVPLAILEVAANASEARC
jgi:sulfur carrier protein ThiS